MNKISPNQIHESDDKRFLTSNDLKTITNKADKLTTYTKKEVDNKLALASSGGIPTFAHSYTEENRTHTLAKPDSLIMPESGIFTARFIAVADYTEGDSFSVAGRAYTAQDVLLNALKTDAFITGSIILIEIDIDHQVISFNISRTSESGSIAPTPSEIQYNVFCQDSEPEQKDGIWIQTNRKYDNILVKQHFSVGGQWDDDSSMRPLPTPREQFRAVSDGERIYCIGGIETGSRKHSTSIEIYDIRSNLWTVGAPMDTPRASFGCVLHNGFIYCFGGDGSSGLLNTMSIYSIKRNTWSVGRPMRYAVRDMGHVVYNSKIYCMGGIGECSNLVYSYDTITGTWEDVARSPVPRSSHGCALYGSKLYCIGGYRANNSVEYFDISTGTWSTCAQMPLIGSDVYDFDFACEIYEEKIYCVGGQNANYVKAYNVLDNTWSVGEPAPIKLSRFACFDSVCIGRDIYCITGDALPVFHIETEQLTDNTLAILDYPNRWNTKIIVNSAADYIRLYFGDIWIYRAGKMQNYPTYVGDGIKWTKLK